MSTSVLDICSHFELRVKRIFFCPGDETARVGRLGLKSLTGLSLVLLLLLRHIYMEQRFISFAVAGPGHLHGTWRLLHGCRCSSQHRQPRLTAAARLQRNYAAFAAWPRICDMFQNSDSAATLYQVLPALAAWHACLLQPHCCLFR
jgi:hypothetical protein